MLWQVAINAKRLGFRLNIRKTNDINPPPPPLSKNKIFVEDVACCRCMVGHEPREFDASRGLVLSNLSEMLVRQLEQKWAESEARQSSVQLMRSLACYEEAFLFLDTSREGDWRALHMNLAASKLLGRHILLTLTS